MKNRHTYFAFQSTLVLLFVVIAICFSSCKTTKSETKSALKQGLTKELPDKDKIAFENKFIDGNKEKLLGNYSNAEKLFLEALKIDPNSSATLYELANIYSFQKKSAIALDYSKRAATLDPSNIWYQLLYADCLKQNKQPEEVAVVYEKLVKLYPDKIEFYYELANAYLYSNKISNALKIYDKMETHFGITEDASLQKITIYKSTKNFDKALQEVQKLIKAFPKEAKYYGMLGELYAANGMGDKALQSFNDLLKIDPNNAFVHLSLADFYRSQKQNDKAFDEIKIAFNSKDLDVDTKVNILATYFEITKTFPELKNDAMELCKIIIDIHPDDAKSFAIYGDFLYRDKKLEEARTQYKKAISLDQSKYQLWENLIEIDLYLNDFVAMEKDSKDAIELFPTKPEPYYYNGLANIQFKKYNEAVEALTEGKEFVIGDELLLSKFYTYLGDSENYLKSYSASDSYYDKSLELNPNNAEVLNNYAYYLSLRKVNLEKAAIMSKKSNDLEPNNNSYQDTYGWILFQENKYDDAKIWIGKALDNGGRGNGTLLEHYGDVLFKLGETENALKYWMDAKKAGGTSELIDKKIAGKQLYE